MKKIKDKFGRFRRYFSHFPLFGRFLVTMTALVLISYIVLTTALFLFLTNHYVKGQKASLMNTVSANAAYCEKILDQYSGSEEKMGNALLLIVNNIGVTSKAINADIMLCDTDGRVILCKDAFDENYSEIKETVCRIHKGYSIPEDIISSIEKDGGYFGTDRIVRLFSEKTFLAGAPVYINDELVGIVFASSPVSYGFKQYTGELASLYITAALCSALISFLAVYGFASNLYRPLKQMSEATKAYAKGDFSKRITVKGKDEMAELCTSFNNMATALSITESSRRSFVANVSHELKTPMTTIGGFIDGILDGTISEEKRPEYLRKVSDEVKRLTRLVTSMLNLSKIEAGELELKMDNFELGNMVINCLLGFEQLIEGKGIEVRGLDSIPYAEVYGDPDMIYQVIYNLCDNAVKFTDENGFIEIRIDERDRDYLFSVRNSGEGISSEEIGRIFERFYKVDKSRSYDSKSAGLGLYLCKTIVDMHGGRISAQSVEGQYTEFSFNIQKKQ